jgi:hypothetical protein
MARKRMLHASFFVSQAMNDVSVVAMVTFEGMWCWADDKGRGEDDPALVKAFVWPRRKAVTEKHVKTAMDALVAQKVLCRYSVAGSDLIHITHWAEHQKISHPTPSKLAPCPIHETADWESFAISHGLSPEDFRSDSGATTEGLVRSVVQFSSDQISSSSPYVTRGSRTSSGTASRGSVNG